MAQPLIIYKNYWIVYKSKASLRSFTDAIRLNLARYNMKSYGLRSFSVCGPKLWNEVPSELRRIHSISTFQTKLKTHLFKGVF